MNEQHDLKIYVERAVRPVVAERSTKIRMREELFAHVQDVYGQELERLSDERAAVARTAERMGDPAALTAELQASVSRIERIEARYNAWFGRRAGETRLRHALRLSSLHPVFTSLLFGAVMIGRLPEIVEWTPQGRFLVGFSVGYVLLFSVIGVMFVFFGGVFRDQWEASFPDMRSIALCLGILTVASLSVLASGWGLTYAVTFDVESAWSTLSQWWLLSAITAPAFVALTYLSVAERRRSREWLSLEIDS